MKLAAVVVACNLVVAVAFIATLDWKLFAAYWVTWALAMYAATTFPSHGAPGQH